MDNPKIGRTYQCCDLCVYGLKKNYDVIVKNDTKICNCDKENNGIYNLNTCDNCEWQGCPMYFKIVRINSKKFEGMHDEIPDKNAKKRKYIQDEQNAASLIKKQKYNANEISDENTNKRKYIQDEQNAANLAKRQKYKANEIFPKNSFKMPLRNYQSCCKKRKHKSNAEFIDRKRLKIGEIE